MENIIKFSEELQELINENLELKISLNRVTKYLKLAICVNGNLYHKFAKGKIDQEIYNIFMNSTSIYYGNTDNPSELIWNRKVRLNDIIYPQFGIVTKEQIELIFNGSKIELI